MNNNNNDNSKNPSSIPSTHDPKMVWYSIKDRYSLDFDAIPHFLDIIKQNNFNTSSPENFEILSHLIDYIKSQFNDRFLSIKGDHILNKMNLEVNPTLAPITPFNFNTALKTDNIHFKLAGYKLRNSNVSSKVEYEWFIGCNSILDILVQNINHNSDHDMLNTDETTRRTHEACLHMYHYFLIMFQEMIKKLIEDNKKITEDKEDVSEQ